MGVDEIKLFVTNQLAVIWDRGTTPPLDPQGLRKLLTNHPLSMFPHLTVFLRCDNKESRVLLPGSVSKTD